MPMTGRPRPAVLKGGNSMTLKFKTSGFLVAAAAALLSTTQAQVAKPVDPAGNPPPPRFPEQPVGVHPEAVTPAPAGLSVTTSNRQQSRAFFNAIFSASDGVPIDWTGSLSGTPGSSATGSAGTTSAAYKDAVQLRINYFRAMAGIPAAISMDSVESAEDQDAALMMSANNALSHTPPSSWLLYTSDGATAAGNSNIALGNVGPDAIAFGYVEDSGSNNTALGHRRWILYPQTQVMGTGDIPATNGFSAANATWVFDSNLNNPRPPVRDNFIAWPPPGYVPYQVVFPRWSLSYPNADFSAATVTMTSNGASVPVMLEALDNPAYGENTIAWDYDGLNGSTVDSSAPQPSSDLTYQVAVDNVVINGTAQNFSYAVTVFDPAVAEPGDTPPSVTGPAAPTVGQVATYTVTGVPSFAGGFAYRSLSVTPFSTVYGAEGGLQGVVALTSPGYNPVDSSEAASGGASYHLAMPDFTTQMLTLPGEYAIQQGTANLTFASSLGFATAGQTAHVQISTNDGTTWNDIYTQAGSGGQGEGSFISRTVNLSPYAGLVAMFRFSYTYSEGQQAFTQTSSGIGWNIDNITLNGVELATVGAPSAVQTGGTFTFTPASTASVALQAEAVLFGNYPVSWGPVLLLTPGAAGPGQPSSGDRLLNLSARVQVGTGANIVIAGLVVSGPAGSTKQILVRGIGPTLSTFGVAGVLANPVMSVYDSATPAKLIASDTGWGNPPVSGSSNVAISFRQATAADMNSVGAFALTSGSADSAMVLTVPTGNYTVQVAGAGSSTGVALAEVYELDSQPAVKLANLSARCFVGTGSQVGIAGFYVQGTQPAQLLIRGIGPALTGFGVSGALAQPIVELYDSATTPQLIASNTGWGNPPVAGPSTKAVSFRQATAADMTAVGAFGLTAGSADSAIVAILPPGSYTAQVSGVGGTTGTALAEVYEMSGP
jgi:hypothetical protein